MIRKLFKNTFIYTIGDFLTLAVSGILLLPYYTRAMSIEEYGVFGVVSAAVALTTFIVHFGMVSAYARYYFMCKTDDDREIYTGHIILIHLGLSLLFVLLALYGKEYFLNGVLSAIDNVLYFYGVLAIAFFSFMNALYSVYLRIIEKPGVFIVIQVATVSLFVILIFCFQKFLNSALESVVLALVVSGSLMWLVSLFGLRYQFRTNGLAEVAKSTMIFGMPIFLAYIMYFFLNKYNVLYLQNYVDKEQLAFFTFALQLSSIIGILAASAGKAIQPILFKLNEADVINMAKKIALIYKAAMLVLLIMSLLFVKEFILFFAPEEYLGSEAAIRVLFISAFFYNFRSVESNLFYYFHRPKYVLIIVSIGAAVVVGLSMSLVPKFGVLASAYSILMGSLVVLALNKFCCYVLIKKVSN